MSSPERRRGATAALGSAPESVFVPDGEGAFTPTAHARGPWDPRALHGGAPAALLAEAFERFEPGRELRIGRLTFEFLRPIPFGRLTLAVKAVRQGRRAQELAGELRSDGLLVCRAGALRVREVPGGASTEPGAPMPGPEQGQDVVFALDGSRGESFAASAMQMRWLDDPAARGPARVWMRLRVPLLAGGGPAGPLPRLAASADFGNGVSAALPFDRWLFINADLTVHLQRLPRGEWIGLDARTVLVPGGSGLAESVLHDSEGPVGRAFQTLVVERR